MRALIVLAVWAGASVGGATVARADEPKAPNPPVPAAAPAPDPRAEALNDEGKALYLEKTDYAAAAGKFRAALAIQADPRYSYNLCAALEKLGQLEPALEACEDVFTHDPRPELAEKAGKRAAALRKAIKAAPPSGPAPAPGPTATPAPAPEETAAAELDEAAGDYRWALGADIGGAHNGLGNEDFGGGGVLVRLGVEAVAWRKLHLGLQPFFDMAYYGKPDSPFPRALTYYEIGVAATWHRRVWRSLDLALAAGPCFTVLAVANADKNDSYANLGLRADAGVEWAFGDGTHVLSVVPFALTFYPGAIGQIGGFATAAGDYGFDHGGVSWAFLVGYRARFQSTLPLLNLE
jgi:hypothetical protein